VRDPFAKDDEFRKMIRGERPVDLAVVNLEMSRDAYPGLDGPAYLDRIDALARRVIGRCPDGSRPLHIIGQINWVLFVEEEFRGNVDDYYDPRNSYLNEVLDRRTGIPISLAVLYQALADRVGLGMAGVNLPVHFLLRVAGQEAPLFVDPFHSGRTLDRDACEQFVSDQLRRPYRLDDAQIVPCDASATVCRMLRNLKGIYLDRQEYGPALPVARRLAALNPGDLAEVRDWGTISLQADRPGEALGPLGRYVEERPQAPDVEAVRSLLKAARREVAFRN
jgi:regulator of sirC expression with transglutaminase-like and TPR domain